MKTKLTRDEREEIYKTLHSHPDHKYFNRCSRCRVDKAAPEMLATLKAIAGVKITRELENRIYSTIAKTEGK